MLVARRLRAVLLLRGVKKDAPACFRTVGATDIDRSTMKTYRRTAGLVIAIAAIGAALIAAPAQAAKDRNHDRISDRWEKRHGLSLKRDQSRRDQDDDGLKNLGEFKARFDPRDQDSDDDGTEDGDEGAGTISSFDPATRELVIDAFVGPDLSGTVTADTEIECEGDEPGEDHHDGDHSGPGGGDDDNSGPGRHARSDDDSDEDDEANCGTDALTPGTVVTEAELRLTQSGAVCEEVELR
jgi:hypothetical protein